MSNSITCNLTISAFYLLSFFIYLLSLSICLLSLFIYLLSLFCYLLSLFVYLFFISFLFLSARRIFVHNYSLFLLYGGAPIVTQLLLYSPIISYSLYGCAPIVTQSPIISYFLILNPPPSSMVRSQNVGMWQTPHFCSTKVYYYLAGIFDSIFFLIEQW